MRDPRMGTALGRVRTNEIARLIDSERIRIMSAFARLVTVGSAGATLTMLALVPITAHATELDHAAPATQIAAPECGYDGYINDQPMYNHCAHHGSVVIEVDHLFWQTAYACMPPGVHAIPESNTDWRIMSAEYDGHTCFGGPEAVVGP